MFSQPNKSEEDLDLFIPSLFFLALSLFNVFGFTLSKIKEADSVKSRQETWQREIVQILKQEGVSLVRIIFEDFDASLISLFIHNLLFFLRQLSFFPNIVLHIRI